MTSPNKPEKLRFGDYILDLHTLSLRRDGVLILLPPKAFDTLLVLVRHRGEVVTKDQLMKLVWPDAFVEENNLAQTVFVLRRRLGPTTAGGEYIQTISKRGYRISVPVQELALDSVGLEPGSASKPEHERSTASPNPIASTWMHFFIAAALLGSGCLAWWWHSASDHLTASRFVQITNQMQVKKEFERPPSLATDGSLIFFTGGDDNSQTLFQVPAVGGETRPIPVPFPRPEILDFSAARSELLVLESSQLYIPGSLWAVPVGGGSPHRLGTFEASDGCWSPDGRSIAFTSGNHLYIYDVESEHTKMIAELPNTAWRPRWSPDASLIRLTVVNLSSNSSSSLWEVNPEGTGLHRLLANWPTPSAECCGNWTSDGRHYLFQATREHRTQIWSLDRSGVELFSDKATPMQVTAGEMNFSAPVPSPDGSKVFMIGTQPRGELDRYDSASHQFHPFVGGISADWIDFSPDSHWMAFSLFPEGTLWRSEIDGNRRLQLTFAPTRVLSPLWSPDGKRILFYDLGGLRPQLLTVSIDGGRPQRVPGSNGYEMSVTWSPDGNALMFSDFPFLLSNPRQSAVHTLDLRTGLRFTVSESAGLFGPVWSPNGRYVAAQTVRNPSVMLFDFVAKRWKQIAEGHDFFRWSRDSRFLFFIKNGNRPAIMKVQVADGAVEEVADVSGIHLAGTLPGLQYSLAPDDAPVVLKDTGLQEIYSADLREH